MDTTIRQKAFEMRKNGKSYNQISKQLGIAKSTLSYWFSTRPSSEKIKQELIKQTQYRAIQRLRSMAKSNQRRHEIQRADWRKQAQNEYLQLQSLPLFSMGIGLYWGEGDKKPENSIVRMGNVDYRLLQVFVRFLLTCCKVDPVRLRAWVLLYPDLDEKECKEFWSAKLHIPDVQFVKSQRIMRKGNPRHLLQYGVCYVYVSQRELKEKIIEWIRLVDIDNNFNAGIV